jgi:hypothetical protein
MTEQDSELGLDHIRIVRAVYTSSTSSIAATNPALAFGGMDQYFFRCGLMSFFLAP